MGEVQETTLSLLKDLQLRHLPQEYVVQFFVSQYERLGQEEGKKAVQLLENLGKLTIPQKETLVYLRQQIDLGYDFNKLAVLLQLLL